MKKVFVYGTAVLALSVAPALAQSSTGAGSSSRPGSAATQSGSQSGSGSSATGSQSGTRSGSSSTQGTKAQSGSMADASKSNPDHQFVIEAAQGGLAEVEFGQLATEKASSDAVKQFGQRMVTDHGKANDELKALAQSKNITLPTDIGKHKATKDKLSKLSGAQFDRAYMQEMVTDHRKDVNDFRKESQSGKDPDVKAWAAKTLPTLEEHLQMAQSTSRGAVGTSGTKSGSEGDKTNGGSKGTTGSSPRTGSSGASGASGGSTSSPRSGSSGSGTSTSSPGAATGSSSPR